MKSSLAIVLLSFVPVIDSGLTRFSNIKCETFDSKFSSFEKCNLKIIDRGVVGMNMTCKLHQTPVTSVSVCITIYKKSNGYHQLFPNTTMDFCSYLKNPQKYPLEKILCDYLLRSSNVNHTCPFNHDIIFENLVLDQRMFAALPLQPGEYMLSAMVGAYNTWRAELKMYMTSG